MVLTIMEKNGNSLNVKVGTQKGVNMQNMYRTPMTQQQKKNNPIQRQAKDLNGHFFKEDTQINNKHKVSQHHQPVGNANQNHNDRSLYTHYDYYYKKHRK